MSTDRFFVGRAAQYPSAAEEPCILVTGGGFRLAVDPRAGFVGVAWETRPLSGGSYATTTSAASFTLPARRSRRSPSVSVGRLSSF